MMMRWLLFIGLVLAGCEQDITITGAPRSISDRDLHAEKERDGCKSIAPPLATCKEDTP